MLITIDGGAQRSNLATEVNSRHHGHECDYHSCKVHQRLPWPAVSHAILQVLPDYLVGLYCWSDLELLVIEFIDLLYLNLKELPTDDGHWMDYFKFL